jgi:hypothetical protein
MLTLRQPGFAVVIQMWMNGRRSVVARASPTAGDGVDLARTLYRSLGFVETGERDEGDS